MKTTARTTVLLDGHWSFYPLRQFTRWPAEPSLSQQQIASLRPPAAGAGWLHVHLPDDYVVRGRFSREPNASLRAKGAVCPLGGREFEVPKSPLPKPASMGALNRMGRDAYGGHGYLPVYPAWYRRELHVPASAKGKRVWLAFGGVYRDAIVFVNGQFVAQHPSGYTGFCLDITRQVHTGGQNEIAVFVDPRWFEGWWYEGGGIYRHVRLITVDPLHIAPWGVFVSTSKLATIRRDATGAAQADSRLTIETTLRNSSATAQTCTVTSRILDATGRQVASVSNPESVPSGHEITVRQEVTVPDARLWSLGHPNLYSVSSELGGGQTEDTVHTYFGIRTLRFEPDRGFFLNERHVEIHGLCNHQDFPGVGIAAPDDLWSWRLQELKAVGANAYRCAHNPVGEAFYDAADRLGMLVMDENRHFGDTYYPKADADTRYDEMSDLDAMVRQHRNHPSIIMWSLFNEEGQSSTRHGANIYAAMKAAVRRLDQTRPVTAAVNGGYSTQGALPSMGIIGMNYHNTEFDAIHRRFPRQMIFGSEDIDAKTSRGTLESSKATGRCAELGAAAHPWTGWVPVVQHPFVAGAFVWTGYDYRGEPNPFSWPAVTSQTGVLDLCGFPKPVSLYWKAAWSRKPCVFIAPDWNLPQSELGKLVLVRIFSNCTRVELSLNGKVLGTQMVSPNGFAEWRIPYAPGRLRAVGYNGFSAVATAFAETAGVPVAVRITPECNRLPADDEEIAPVRAEIVDANGRVVTTADTLVSFSVSGPGTLAGTDNGDPASHEQGTDSSRHAFQGRCMALVRVGGRPGTIVIQARAVGLKPTTADLIAIPSPPHHS